MNICFYIRNLAISNIDCRAIELGNPGVGGSEFAFIAVPYYFNKLLPGKHEFYYLSQSTDLLPSSVKSEQVQNLDDALSKAKEMGCDVFIWRPMDDDNFQLLSLAPFKLIAWEQCISSQKKLFLLSKLPKLKRFVCVSHEHVDMIRNSDLFYKSNFIYNGVDVKGILTKVQKNEKLVIYVGSLDMGKGFHHVAASWPKIIADCPDAKLEVIGGGNLYDKTTKLGELGIAEEEYEKNYIKPFLFDRNGKLLDSVKFHGVMGYEKYRIMSGAIIGIVNPSNSLETFGITAVEFQLHGTAVVSGKRGGILETVLDKKTGLLAKSTDISNEVIYLLNNPKIAIRMGENGKEFIANKFSFEEVIQSWDKIIDQVINDIPNSPLGLKKNIFHNRKIFFEFNRIIRRYFKLDFINLFLKAKGKNPI